MEAIGHALSEALNMAWVILWPLILGFFLSGLVQAVVSHDQMSRLLPDDKFKSIARASGLGAASSSCSYAAVALARSLYVKGANFTAAIVFEVASTNLVLELGILMALLLGWEFTLAEYVGGVLMIIAIVLLFRATLRQDLLTSSRTQAKKGVAGRMEGHAAMHDMTEISHYFVMDWASVYLDILIGLLIAGALAAWVPDSFWQSFFLVHHPLLAKLWGPLIGPVVAMLSFVCSIGNVPLAAVLWNGGISFGGVASFIFADLIILPILNIYRKYYGRRMATYLLATLYVTMVLAGYLVELIFGVLNLTPTTRHAQVLNSSISWNYTTYLNIAFLVLATVLVWRFIRTGGPAMLRMMSNSEHAQE